MTQPFKGITVVDMTHVLAGPFAAYQLAVLGADVIKVEHPAEPDQVRETGTDPELGRALMGTNYLAQASNKRSLTLDIRTSEGRSALLRLVERADVFVENYRAGALADLGLSYDDLRIVRPDLIYCSVTGFGQTGAKRDHTAYDGVIQAASGLMSVSGTPEITPLKVGAPVVDYAAGAMAAFAISSALFQRERNGGQSQYIDVSMFDAALMLLSSTLTGYSANGAMLSVPRGNEFSSSNGCCYQTADGLLMIAALNSRQHVRLWTVMGRQDIAERSGLEQISVMEAEMKAELTRRFGEKSAAEWETVLNEAGVPAARVRTLPEALAMAQVRERGVLHHHSNLGRNGIDVPVAPFLFAHDGPKVCAAPPTRGEHTEAILRELGYSDLEIGRMRASAVA
ncbi:MAG: CoA transferase [Lautropia sp.]